MAVSRMLSWMIWVRHADGSGKKRSDADEEDEQIDAFKEIVHHREHHLRIEYHYALLVRRVDVVTVGNDCAYVVGDVAHRYAGLGGDVKEIDVCAAVIHLLHERERHED